MSDNNLRTLPLGQGTKKGEELPYTVLLENGERLSIKADSFTSAGDEEGSVVEYIFYKKNKPVAMLEGGAVKAVLHDEAVDVSLAITAIKKTKRKVKDKA